MPSKFTGTFTAIVTPFRSGEIDEAALKTLIELQIKGGVDGIVPVGTTGESPTQVNRWLASWPGNTAIAVLSDRAPRRGPGNPPPAHES